MQITGSLWAVLLYDVHRKRTLFAETGIWWTHPLPKFGRSNFMFWACHALKTPDIGQKLQVSENTKIARKFDVYKQTLKIYTIFQKTENMKFWQIDQTPNEIRFLSNTILCHTFFAQKRAGTRNIAFAMTWANNGEWKALREFGPENAVSRVIYSNESRVVAESERNRSQLTLDKFTNGFEFDGVERCTRCARQKKMYVVTSTKSMAPKPLTRNVFRVTRCVPPSKPSSSKPSMDFTENSMQKKPCHLRYSKQWAPCHGLIAWDGAGVPPAPTKNSPVAENGVSNVQHILCKCKSPRLNLFVFVHTGHEHCETQRKTHSASAKEKFRWLKAISSIYMRTILPEFPTATKRHVLRGLYSRKNASRTRWPVLAAGVD